MKKLVSALAVVAAFGLSASAHAAGYQLDVMSARGTGMAATLTAGVDDASAIFYNPAGMARGKHLDLELGDTLIIPTFSYTPPDGSASTSTESEVVPPPHAFVSWGVTDALTLGIGEFSEYGLGLTWPDTTSDGSPFVGTFLVKSISLQTFNINPSAAFRFGDRIRVGLGVQIVRGTVSLEQNLNFVDSVGSVDLAGSAWGAGGNAGVQVDVLPKILTLGAAFRSSVALNFNNGKAHFSNIPVEFQDTLKDQQGTTKMTLPNSFQIGATVHPTSSIAVAFDADYTGWQSNSAIVLTFDDPQLSKVEPKNWHHSWNYHLGAEFALNKQVTLRAGVLYDPTPSPDDTVGPDLPDANRINIALGGRYTIDNFKIDLGYQLVLITTHTSTNPLLPGDYKGLAHVVALTLGWGK